MKYLSTKY